MNFFQHLCFQTEFPRKTVYFIGKRKALTSPLNSLHSGIFRSSLQFCSVTTVLPIVKAAAHGKNAISYADNQLREANSFTHKEKAPRAEFVRCNRQGIRHPPHLLLKPFASCLRRRPHAIFISGNVTMSQRSYLKKCTAYCLASDYIKACLQSRP